MLQLTRKITMKPFDNKWTCSWIYHLIPDKNFHLDSFCFTEGNKINIRLLLDKNKHHLPICFLNNLFWRILLFEDNKVKKWSRCYGLSELSPLIPGLPPVTLVFLAFTYLSVKQLTLNFLVICVLFIIFNWKNCGYIYIVICNHLLSEVSYPICISLNDFICKTLWRI